MNALIENFHFLRPLWLLAALPALGLFFICWRTQNQASEWQSEIAPHLLPWLVDGTQSTGSKLPWYALLLLWLVTVIALAGPTWEKLPQPLMKDSSALVIAFDLSPSMNVKDLTPSRVMRARLKLIDLLDTRKEGLTALVAYAGEAHVVTPLTDDVETIKNLVPSLAPHTMPVPGSNIEMALEMANRLLKDAGVAHGNIVFITDGIAASAFGELKKLQNNSGHKVAVWGFGTEAGAPIQLPDGGFARNKNGEIVVAKLDEEQLSDAAVSMGGLYVPYTDTAEDIDTIRSFSIDPFNKQQREVEREFDQWVEFGPWLVLLCLPLVALSFRRGLILSLLLVAGLQPLTEVHSQEQALQEQLLQQQKSQQTESKNEGGLWDELWLTRNQRAQRALDAGDAETAANLFEQPQRKGTANFRANNFEEAAKFFKQSENSADSWFNQGTALTHAGKYDEALAAYNKALELQPEFPEARNNMEITQKLRELEKQQQQQQQNNQQNQDQQSQDQQSQNQQSQDQQSQDQQSSSNQNQQPQNSEQQNADQQQSGQETTQNNPQQEDEQQADQQQAQQQADAKADEERAQQNFEKQLAEAQKQQEQQQQEQQEQAVQQPQELAAQEQAKQEAQQAYMDPEQLAASEDQQKLEQLLRRVPDDPGRLLRNKFRYEAQQRRMEANPETWNTLENAEEERW